MNGIFYLLELMNLLRNLFPAIFDSFEGNFIHALCRRTEILNSLPRVDKGVLLRNRLVGRRDGYVDLRKKTNMTQPAKLDWSCHATTIA